MRIIFMGSPEFAVTPLAELAKIHEICAVFAAPPAIRSRRGNQLSSCPVANYATTHNLPLFTPKTLKTPIIYSQIANFSPDIIIVVAYGALLPQNILDLPRFGCLNLHGSALPRWRGAAPIERAIEAGDNNTAVCVMKMEAGLDTGPVALQQTIPIERQTAGELRQQMSVIGSQLLSQSLKLLATNQLKFTAQQGVPSYAAKINKEQTQLDLTTNAIILERKIRALNPNPGAWLPVTLIKHNGQHEFCRLKIWRAEAYLSPQPKSLGLATGSGSWLKIIECQKPGGKITQARELLNSYHSIEPASNQFNNPTSTPNDATL